jgi:hypothetical protein
LVRLSFIRGGIMVVMIVIIECSLGLVIYRAP